MTTATETNAAFQAIARKYGFVPNVLREMGTKSPAALNVYLGGNEAMANSSLNQQELNTVMLAVSQANGCHYCTKAHSALLKGAGLTREAVEAIEGGELSGDGRLKSLVSATRLIHEKKGWLAKEDLEKLEREGIGRVQVYEIIALIGLKTISNYINHINQTKVDRQFEG